MLFRSPHQFMTGVFCGETRCDGGSARSKPIRLATMKAHNAMRATRPITPTNVPVRPSWAVRAFLAIFGHHIGQAGDGGTHSALKWGASLAELIDPTPAADEKPRLDEGGAWGKIKRLRASDQPALAVSASLASRAAS